MREDLTIALQARWEESLRERTAIDLHTPVPLLDNLLSPFHAAPRDRDRVIKIPPPSPVANTARSFLPRSLFSGERAAEFSGPNCSPSREGWGGLRDGSADLKRSLDDDLIPCLGAFGRRLAVGLVQMLLVRKPPHRRCTCGPRPWLGNPSAANSATCPSKNRTND
jgi:hypothetical protein